MFVCCGVCEILRTVALDEQPLAMNGLATLANAVLYLFLLHSAWTTSFSCC